MNSISAETFEKLDEMRKDGETMDSCIKRIITSYQSHRKIPDKCRDKVKELLSLPDPPPYPKICEQVTYIKNGVRRHITLGTVAYIRKEMNKC